MSEPIETTQPVWNFKAIPHHLKQLEQWNLCYHSGQLDPKGDVITTAKRPIGGPRSPFTMMPLKRVQDKITPGQYFGICLNAEDDIAILDVDSLPEDWKHEDLPERIRTLLDAFPTYAEISPSGQGLHIVYRTNKSLLAHRKDQDKSTQGFKGSVFLRNQFITFTGHQYRDTAVVAEIDASLFENLTLASGKVKAISSAPNQRGLSAPSFTLEDVERWLTKIPPNLSESPLQPLLNRAYARFDPPIVAPEDYMHWQYMAAAVHKAAADLNQVDAGEDIFTEWSLQGANDGEQNIRQKYRDNPPTNTSEDLTHLTLVNLASSVKPVWPFPRMKMVKGNPEPTDEPDTGNILNWECLLDQYSIKLGQNEISKEYRVKALSQIKNRYFDKIYQERGALKADLQYFAQDNNMPKATAPHTLSATEWWLGQGTEQYNPIKEWIDEAPPLASDEGSWFQALWETIELYPHDQANEELYRSYLKKNLMGVIRAHYYTGQYATTTGIVILQGAESTYKSTWVTQLLPQSLQEYVFPSQAELSKNAKEVSLEAGVCQIWLKDEVEAFISGSKFMKNADGALKSFLVQSHDAYRPLFGSKPIQVARKCIFFGTTNEQELALSSTGNRRIQIIPVKQCDTSTQAKIPMVKVYQELLQEFRDTPAKQQPDLWRLSKAEESSTDEINYSERKLESGGDVNIRDVFDFEASYDVEPFLSKKGNLVYAKLWKIKDIAAKIYEKTGDKPTTAALKHVLKRQVGKWSGTSKLFKAHGNWSIEYGMAKYRNEGKVKQSGYLMPPLASDELPFEKELT
ncbi:MAG: VapE domain-containing protein [Candidatus Methanospirareceae archaeon]